MRWFTILLLVAVSSSVIAISSYLSNTGKPAIKALSLSGEVDAGSNHENLARLKRFTTNLPGYTLRHHFNNRYCFLIDMRLPSGSKRFFIYDFKEHLVLQSGLVTYGSGKLSTANNIYFSNKPGSNCTSIGKYKVGKSYYGKFGLAYQLHGLDATNNNALKRFVVLHAHPCVPDSELTPGKICMSQGCPTISPSFLQQVKTYIDQSGAPVLLWIIN